MAELTRGVIPQIVAGAGGLECVLQVVGIKKLNNSQQQPGSDRFRLLLSDGEFSYSAMLATQFSHVVLSGQIKETSIIRVIDYLCNQLQEKKVMIVLNMEVLQAEAPKIGNPQMFHESKAAGAGAGAGGAHPGPAAQNIAPNLQQQQQQQQYGGPAPSAPQFGGYGAAPSGAPGGGPGGNFGGGDQYGAPAAGGMAGPGGYGGGGMNQQPFNQGPGPGNPYGAPPSNPYGGGPGAPPGNPYGAGPPHGGAGGPPGNPYGAPQGGGGGPPGNPYGAPPANPYGPGPGSMYRGSGPVVKNEASNVMPINSLNSYQNRWTIKARVTAKSDIRRFSNARGEGKFFTFDLLDADGGEIRVYGWNDACDKYVNSVEVGTVYMLSKASLRNKRGNFNQTRHPYEIHLERDSVVEPCGEDQSIPRIMFDFRPISDLEDTPAGNMVDVIGVVESVNDWAMITKRDGGETQKRSLTIKDQSNRSIEVTLWGAYANNPGDELQQMVQGGHKPVLVVKGARVGDFNGKTLSTVGSSTIMVDPHDVEQAGTLRNWYDNGGGSMAAEALSNARAGGGRADRRIFLSQIKDEGLGVGAPAWVQVLATCSYVRDKNMYYAACPLQFNGKQCNKKMQDQGGGSWFCERCNQMAQPEWRYIVSITIDDHTANTWATAFAESAPELLGVTAGQLKDFEDNGDTYRFSHAMQNAMFRPLTLKLKVNEDNWNDEQRIRVSVVRVEPTDLVKESRSMIDSIYKMQRGEPIMQAQGAFPQQQQQQQQQYGGGGFGGPPRTPYGAGGPPQQQQQGYGGGYGGGQQQQGGWGGGQQGGGGGWNQNQQGGGGGGGGWQQQQGGWNQQQGGGGGWNQGGNQGGGYGGGGGGGGGYGGGVAW